MKLFENRVGRPSNETKNMRQVFVISIAAILISVVTLFVCLLSKSSVLTKNLKGAVSGNVLYGLNASNKNDIEIKSYPSYAKHNGTINFPNAPKYNVTSGKKCSFKGWIFQKLDDKKIRVLTKSGSYAWLPDGDSQIQRYAYFGGVAGTKSYRLNLSINVKLYAAFDCKNITTTSTSSTITPSITLGGTITAGKSTEQFNIKTTGSKVSVSSSNSNVLKVVQKGNNTASGNKWTLKAIKGGTATITVTAGNAKKTYKYTVKDTLSTELSSNGTLTAGKSSKEVGVTTTASSAKVTSSNSNVVKVVKSGSKWSLKPKKAGTATITVAAGNAKKTYTYKVKDNGYNKTINAVLETARAYYRQGAQIQYDSYRKNLSLTPEDATSQHINYTVCSGFTYSVYKNALGINLDDYTSELLDFADNYKDKNDIKKHIIYSKGDSKNKSTVLSKKELSTFLSEQKFKPGDLFVYKDGTGFGHVVLIESIDDKGNISILEAAGTNYDYNNHAEKFEKNGSINRTTLYQRLNQATSNAELTSIAVIRVVTDENKCINKNNNGKFEVKTCKMTSSASSRLAYEGFDIEKTVTISGSSSPIYATVGDTITYAIKIKNNSKDIYENIKVKEQLKVDGKVIKDLSKTINLGANSSTTIKYTYVVKKDYLNKVIISTGTVANIPSSKIEVLVGKRLTAAQINTLKNSFNKYKSDSSKERQFINQIYGDKDGLNINLGLYDSTKKKELSNLSIISYVNDKTLKPVRYTKFNNTTVKKYVYRNFYGLRIGATTGNGYVSVNRGNIVPWAAQPSIESNDRARTITPDMLLEGDIILTYANQGGTKLKDRAYIYLNGTIYRKDAANKFLELKGNDITMFLRDTIGDNYIILRPYK